MIFHWSLSHSKSPQVSRTLLSILTDFNNAVVWMVSNHPLISKSPSPCTNPLVAVPSAAITIGIIITFMFHSFFSCLTRSRYLSLFTFSFSFTMWLAETVKSTVRPVCLFFYWLSLGLVVWPRLDVLRWGMLLLGFRFKLVLRWLGSYYVGCYPLAKCWWKIKVVEKNEDVVRFCMKVLMAAWS